MDYQQIYKMFKELPDFLRWIVGIFILGNLAMILLTLSVAFWGLVL